MRLGGQTSGVLLAPVTERPRSHPPLETVPRVAQTFVAVCPILDFVLTGDYTRHLILLNHPGNFTDNLFLTVLELTGFAHHLTALSLRVASGKLLAYGKNFLIQVDQQTFNRNT